MMNPRKANINRSDSALKAGTWYVISSVFVKAIAVLTTPIFTRIMTKEQYGITSAFASWCALLLPFCTINLTFSIGRAKLDYPGKLDDYIGSMQLLSAVVSMGIAMMCLVFLHPISKIMRLDKTVIVLLLLYLMFTPAIQFVQNGYRYRYQYKQNIAIALYTGICTVLLSLLLMHIFPGKDKAMLRIVGIVLPNCILSLFFWGRSLCRGHIQPNLEYWKYGLRLSMPLVMHTVSLNILSQSDRVFIQTLQGESSTAIYSLAYNYGLALSMVTNAIADGWLPWFHDHYFKKDFTSIRNNTRTIVILGCYVGLACVAFAPEAIQILGGKGYESGVACVPPIVLGIVCQFIYTHYVNIELHLKKTLYVSIGTIGAALLNIVLNSVFIPKYGYVAAAYTTLASYFVLMIAHYLITRCVLKVKLYQDRFMFASLVVTFAFALIVEMTYSSPLLRFGLILMGFISFVLAFRQYILAFLRKISKPRD